MKYETGENKMKKKLIKGSLHRDIRLNNVTRIPDPIKSIINKTIFNGNLSVISIPFFVNILHFLGAFSSLIDRSLKVTLLNLVSKYGISVKESIKPIIEPKCADNLTHKGIANKNPKLSAVFRFLNIRLLFWQSTTKQIIPFLWSSSKAFSIFNLNNLYICKNLTRFLYVANPLFRDSY